MGKKDWFDDHVIVMGLSPESNEAVKGYMKKAFTEQIEEDMEDILENDPLGVLEE